MTYALPTCDFCGELGAEMIGRHDRLVCNECVKLMNATFARKQDTANFKFYMAGK